MHEDYNIRKLKLQKHETNVFVGEVYSSRGSIANIHVLYPDMDDWDEIPSSFKNVYNDHSTNYLRCSEGRIFNSTDDEGRPCKFIAVGIPQPEYGASSPPLQPASYSQLSGFYSDPSRNGYNNLYDGSSASGSSGYTATGYPASDDSATVYPVTGYPSSGYPGYYPWNNY